MPELHIRAKYTHEKARAYKLAFTVHKSSVFKCLKYLGKGKALAFSILPNSQVYTNINLWVLLNQGVLS